MGTLRLANQRLTESLRRLEESRAGFVELYDCAPFAYLTLDGAGIIRDINLVGVDLLGAGDQQQAVGRRLRSFVLEDDRAILTSHLQRCRQEPETVTCEVRLMGEPPIPVQLLTRPAKQRSYLFGVALIDLRERKRQADENQKLSEAEREARAASEAKDRFIAMLSHELRTPLTPVLLAVSALRERADLPEAFRATCEMIHRNVTTEARLIDDLLDVTRIARSTIVLDRRPTDIHACAREAVEMLASQAQARQHGVTVALEAQRHHVDGDPTRLRQVLWNLLRNAVKFTPQGGRIEVRSWNNDRWLALEVSDSGVGFRAEDASGLFSPFEQGSHLAPGGLGLGLAICKGLVDLHDGRITAASAGAGRGARFVVELVAVAEPAAATASAPEPRPPGDKPRILLVEDHEDSAAALSDLLIDAGYQVRVASTVRSALAVDLDQVDLVVSDIGLPDASGLDLMRQLAAMHRIKGIALSGYGTEADVRASREAGFSAHLTKPVDLDRLLAEITDLSGGGR